MDFEIPLLDNSVWPDKGHKLVLSNQLARALHQRDQDIQSPAAEAYRPIAFQQQSLCHEQTKGTEARALALGRAGGRRGEGAHVGVQCRGRDSMAISEGGLLLHNDLGQFVGMAS
jgi:hypothetical protein